MPRASTKRLRLRPFFPPIRGVRSHAFQRQRCLACCPVHALPAPGYALHLVVLGQSRLPYFPEKAFPVTYARKDLSYAVALGDQVGVDVTGAKNLVACFDQAIASGWGEKYAPAISLVFEGAQPGS